MTCVFIREMLFADDTETALLKVANDLLTSLDEGKFSVLVLLDLSAAYDTIEHDILLHRLCDVGRLIF